MREIETDYLVIGAGAADDPRLASALARWSANIEPALAKLETLMAQAPRPGQDRAPASP